MFLLLFNYVQVMVRGCPLGFTPAFDTSVGFENVKGCESRSDCPSGAECLFSPISPVYLCCRQNLTYTTMSPVHDSGIGLTIYFADADPPRNVTSAVEGAVKRPIAVPSIPAAVAAVAASANISDSTASSGPGLTISGNMLIPLPGVWSRLPDVRPIVIGRLLPLPGRPHVWQRYGSVTLIRDNGYNIIVDTGSGPRMNDVKAGLASLGVTPAQIHMVILTHGHPDHFGNTQLFPLAQFLYGSYLFKGEEFLSYGLNQARTVKLTDHTEIWSTPGHTQDSITVVVKDVPYGGVVAVTGDLFMSESDLEDPGIWINTSTNANVQLESRNYVICRVNWIIPGHDKMFKVTNTSRIAAGCTSQTPEPTIPFPQLPQHSSYEEQNAIRYAYYAYNILDRVPSSSSAQQQQQQQSNPRTNLVVMNDQSTLLSNPPVQQTQRYVAQLQSGLFPQQPHQQQQFDPSSSLLLHQEVPGHPGQPVVNQKQPQLAVVQHQQAVLPVPAAVPVAAPATNPAAAGTCCIFLENQPPPPSPPKKFLTGPVLVPPSPWQQPGYQAVSYTGEGGLPPLSPAQQQHFQTYRNGKN